LLIGRIRAVLARLALHSVRDVATYCGGSFVVVLALLVARAQRHDLLRGRRGLRGPIAIALGHGEGAPRFAHRPIAGGTRAGAGGARGANAGVSASSALADGIAVPDGLVACGGGRKNGDQCNPQSIVHKTYSGIQRSTGPATIIAATPPGSTWLAP